MANAMCNQDAADPYPQRTTETGVLTAAKETCVVQTEVMQQYLHAAFDSGVLPGDNTPRESPGKGISESSLCVAEDARG